MSSLLEYLHRTYSNFNKYLDIVHVFRIKKVIKLVYQFYNMLYRTLKFSSTVFK